MANKIDTDKFICDFLSTEFSEEEKENIRYLYNHKRALISVSVIVKAFKKALKKQGFQYNDGEIVEIDQPPLTEEQKANFKVGDWIVVDGVTQQVTQIRPEGFDTDRAWNGKSTFKDVHLWTIQDAKDGDVLYNEDCKNIILFNGKVYVNDEPGAYCGYDIRYGELEIFELDHSFCSNNIHPATKYQRDMLNKKMEEAGYTWNQEELKLEKIDKPQTIKFNEPEKFDSVWPKEVVDELLEETQKNTPKVKEGLKKFFSNVFPTIYDIDIEKMVEEYKEGILISQSLTYDDLLVRATAYKKGLEDMLKLIKEGGSNESID